MERTEAKSIVEAILFTMGESEHLNKMAEVLELEKKETRSIAK